MRNVLQNKVDLIDFQNIINGGVVYCHFNLEHSEEYIIAHLKCPGVKLQDIEVSLKNNLLVIQIFSRNLWGDSIPLPIYNRLLEIPYFIDPDNISASYSKGNLKVVLPLDPDKKIVNRKINIQRD
jgi:HSP20 family protein